jgi:hypothetical protein
MQLIKPVAITDTVLTSSNVPETDYAEYSSGTTYSVGQKVKLAATHRVYESLVASNLNHPPASSTDHWLDIAPTNRWAMFDGVVGTLTSKEGGITFTLTSPSSCTSLALLDVHGLTVTVDVVYAGANVYSKTRLLSDSTGSADWYSYLYTPALASTSAIFTDLPGYAGAVITVAVSALTRPAEIGTCILGSLKTLGLTKYGASIGITDYSKKTKDDFGNYTIVERAYSKKGRYSLEVPRGQVDFVYQLLAELRATPVLYLGTDIYESTTVYGFYKDFDIVISYPTYSDCSIEIEGLI